MWIKGVHLSFFITYGEPDNLLFDTFFVRKLCLSTFFVDKQVDKLAVERYTNVHVLLALPTLRLWALIFAGPRTGAMKNPGKPRKLLDQLADRLRAKHYAYRTEQAYLHWVRRFILFHHKRHPRKMGAAEIEQFFGAVCLRVGANFPLLAHRSSWSATSA